MLHTFPWLRHAVRLAGLPALLSALTWTHAAGPAMPVIDEEAFQAAARKSFLPNNPQEFDRLNDPTLATCNRTKDAPSDKEVEAILKRERAAIAYPAGGQLVGDWRKGKQWSEMTHGGRIGVPGFADADNPARPNGANCYACHAIDPGFPQAGNMGPPLQGYGRLRPMTEDMVRYTYEKVYKAKVFNPCSMMPRYGGAQRLLTPQQVADIVAFLMSPESPVNQDTQP